MKNQWRDLLRYGKFITDDNITDDNGNAIRIRIIYNSIDGLYYYHKMINGEIIKVKAIAEEN